MITRITIPAAKSVSREAAKPADSIEPAAKPENEPVTETTAADTLPKDGKGEPPLDAEDPATNDAVEQVGNVVNNEKNPELTFDPTIDDSAPQNATQVQSQIP